METLSYIIADGFLLNFGASSSGKMRVDVGIHKFFHMFFPFLRTKEENI